MLEPGIKLAWPSLAQNLMFEYQGRVLMTNVIRKAEKLIPTWQNIITKHTPSHQELTKSFVEFFKILSQSAQFRTAGSQREK